MIESGSCIGTNSIEQHRSLTGPTAWILNDHDRKALRGAGDPHGSASVVPDRFPGLGVPISKPTEESRGGMP